MGSLKLLTVISVPLDSALDKGVVNCEGKEVLKIEYDCHPSFSQNGYVIG